MTAAAERTPSDRRTSALSSYEEMGDLGFIDYLMKQKRHGCSECIYMNPASSKGKRAHFFQMLLLPLIPIVALIIQNCLSISNIMDTLQEAHSIHNQVDYLFSIFARLHATKLRINQLSALFN